MTEHRSSYMIDDIWLCQTSTIGAKVQDCILPSYFQMSISKKFKLNTKPIFFYVNEGEQNTGHSPQQKKKKGSTLPYIYTNKRVAKNKKNCLHCTKTFCPTKHIYIDTSYKKGAKNLPPRNEGAEFWRVLITRCEWRRLSNYGLQKLIKVQPAFTLHRWQVWKVSQCALQHDKPQTPNITIITVCASTDPLRLHTTKRSLNNYDVHHGHLSFTNFLYLPTYICMCQ